MVKKTKIKYDISISESKMELLFMVYNKSYNPIVLVGDIILQF